MPSLTLATLQRLAIVCMVVVALAGTMFLAPRAQPQVDASSAAMASCLHYPGVNGGGSGTTWAAGIMSCAGPTYRSAEVGLWRDITAFPDQNLQGYGADAGYKDYFVPVGPARCVTGNIYGTLTGDYWTTQSGRISASCS